jgi:hypothetical protein
MEQWTRGVKRLLRSLALGIALLIPFRAISQGPPAPNPLKLLISIEQQTIPAPFPARIILHFHNSGNQTLWLYHKARDPEILKQIAARHARLVEEQQDQSTRPENYSYGGATLTAKLDPVTGGGKSGTGTVLESVALPHPRLVRLGPGDDYEEKEAVRLNPPALAEAPAPQWGQYRLTVTYGAQFSNGDAISRNLATVIWQGEVTSNAIEVNLTSPSGNGAISGTVTSEGNVLREGMMASLTDANDRLIDQALTDSRGMYEFSGLPPGVYWVWVRNPRTNVDTAQYHHLQLSSAAPNAESNMTMLDPETYEPKQVEHKPVLILVTDNASHPIPHAGLEITWSSGTVMEHLKGEAGDDGFAPLQLISGRNYVTLRSRGCPKQESIADVAEAGGIDGFKLVFECKGK